MSLRQTLPLMPPGDCTVHCKPVACVPTVNHSRIKLGDCVSHENISVSRRELYDQVWSEPMTKLAPKYGLSDVGLAKVCKKHEIPRPPVGHWAKLANGKKSPQPELPELDQADLEEIRFFRTGFDAEPSAKEPSEPKLIIEVKDHLRKPHRLVDKAREKLRASEPDQRGVVSVHGQRCLSISVTKKSLTRALKILNALIQYWEQSGGTVSAGEPGTKFSREDGSVCLALSERITRIEKPSEYSFIKDYRYEATGKLTLSIDGWGDGLRKNWSDGKVQRLENVLGKVATTLDQWITLDHERRLDKQCEVRQERAAQEVRRIRDVNSKSESERVKALNGHVDSWVRAEQIRGYVSAFEQKIASNEVNANEPEVFAKWMTWARWYADSICPMTPSSPPPEMDEPITHTNTLVTNLDLTAKTRKALEGVEAFDTDTLAQLSRKEIEVQCGSRNYLVYREITRVLEGLGYDVADRSRW